MKKTAAAVSALFAAVSIALLTVSCGQNEIEDPTGFGDTGTDSDIEAQNKRELNRLNWSPYTDPDGEFRVQFTKRPETDNTGNVRSFAVDAGDAGDFELMVVPHGEDELWKTRAELISDLTTDDDPTDKVRIISKDTKKIQAKGTEVTEVRLKIRGYYFEYTTQNGVKTGTPSPLNSSRVCWFIPAKDENKTYFLSMDTLRPEPEIEKEFFGAFTTLKKPEPAPENKE